MKLKSVFQMWSQKSCEKAAIHVCLLRPTSAIQNCIGLLLYALADAAPGLSLPWNSVVLDHIVSAPSRTWPRILSSVVFSPAFALLHSSGVCMLEFMLIDNNQLPSFFFWMTYQDTKEDRAVFHVPQCSFQPDTFILILGLGEHLHSR